MPTIKLTNQNKVVYRLNSVVGQIIGNRVSCNCCGDPNLGCALVPIETETLIDYADAVAFRAGGTISVVTNLIYSATLAWTQSFFLPNGVTDNVTATLSSSTSTTHNFTKATGCEIFTPDAAKSVFVPNDGSNGVWQITTVRSNSLTGETSTSTSTLNASAFVDVQYRIRIYRDTMTRRHYFWHDKGATAEFEIFSNGFILSGFDSFVFRSETFNSTSSIGFFDSDGRRLTSASGSGTINQTMSFTPSAP
jgi:hypothetical protein